MKNIYKALADFQQEVPPIHKGTQGFGYSYADLSAIFKVINPLMKKHKLGFTQLLNGEDLKTVIFHVTSGESIESTVHIQQDVQLAKMNTFQVLGSAITYYRRYSLSAALGLITDKDIDACGEQETKAPTPPKKEALTESHPRYAGAKKALDEGKTTLEVIKQTFTVSKAVEKSLTSK